MLFVPLELTVTSELVASSVSAMAADLVIRLEPKMIVTLLIKFGLNAIQTFGLIYNSASMTYCLSQVQFKCFPSFGNHADSPAMEIESAILHLFGRLA